MGAYVAFGTPLTGYNVLGERGGGGRTYVFATSLCGINVIGKVCVCIWGGGVSATSLCGHSVHRERAVCVCVCVCVCVYVCVCVCVEGGGLCLLHLVWRQFT